uniref:Uncharacterized protein n=1 Tax=Laticauda laticaudata TaxID=8630 RepID=A0A8C5S7H9_LATLA
MSGSKYSVSHHDNTVYNLYYDHCLQYQFVTHACLDDSFTVDESMWLTNNIYLKKPDSLNNSCHHRYYVIYIVYIMLHDVRQKDEIKHFLTKFYDVKFSMEHCYETNSPIPSTILDR